MEEDEESILKRLWKYYAWNNKNMKPCHRPLLAHWRRLSSAKTQPKTGMSTIEELYNVIQGEEDLMVEEDEESILKKIVEESCLEQQEYETLSQASTGLLAPVVRCHNTAQNRYEYR